MAQVPTEVSPPIVIEGTAQADVIAVTEGTVAPLISLYSADDPFEVLAQGGNDHIIRDRTGHYVGYGQEFFEANIEGGTGIDTLNYAIADGPIVANLTPGIHIGEVGNPIYGYGFVTQAQNSFEVDFGWTRGIDYVKSIEWLIGSNFNDTIEGSAGANRLWGHGGDDRIYGKDGDDRIYGDHGDDDLFGDKGKDRLEGGDGDDFLHGGDHNDELFGDDGNDELHGNSGNDVLKGGDGNDDLRGGSGNDVIRAGDGANEAHGDSGADTIYFEGFGDNEIWGGSGIDKAVYSQAVVVNLAAGYAWRGQNGVDGLDTLASIENIKTGQHADAVIGSDIANDIRLGSGNDWAYALGGNDKIYGEAGNDTLLGGDGNDQIYGGSGADELWGGDGADLIVGHSGGDRIAGGHGADTIRLNGYGSPGSDADVIAWEAGDLGTDIVHGFTLAHDRFDFEPGFLAAGAREDNLLVFDSGLDALLFAKVAGEGWQAIALLKKVDSDALEAAIEDGSIFDVEVGVLGGGAPGGLQEVGPAGLDPAALLDIGVLSMF